jgi:hypothetical protein
VSEHRAEFVQALRSGKTMRNCMFRVLEERHATDFANGRKGVAYYNDLFDAVSSADVPEALEEFESRFLPLLDPDGSRARAAATPSEAPASEAPSWIRRDGKWLMGAFVAVAVAGIVALNGFAEPSKSTAAPTLAATTALTEATAPSAVAAEAKLAADLKPTEEGSPATAESQVVEAEPIKSESTSRQADEQ